MKRLVPMNSADEYDALTKGGREVHNFRPGQRADVKRGFRRRERHTPMMCADCGIYPADSPCRLCPGCDAYREHYL